MNTKPFTLGIIFAALFIANLRAEDPPQDRELAAATGAAKSIRYSLPPRRGDILVLDSEENKLVPLASSNPAYDFVTPVYYFAIDFNGVMNSTNRGEVIDYVKTAYSWISSKMDQLNKFRKDAGLPLIYKDSELADNEIWGYFQTRRWLPMRVGSVLLKEEQKHLTSEKWPSSVTVIHRAVRSYPQDEMASHLVGRFSPGLANDWKSKEDINESDFLYPQQRAGLINGKKYGTGLESSLSEFLDSGTPSIMQRDFDADGKVIGDSDKVVKAGKDGEPVLLTIDYRLQKIAEQLVHDSYKKLINGKKYVINSNAAGLPKGIVIIDLRNMSIAAMASSPTFDLQRLSPGYGANDTYLHDLEDEKENKKISEPLDSRAFENSYPPASTFKLITAMAGLESGVINDETQFSCPESITYGKHTFHNHMNEAAAFHMDHDPMYNYAQAIKRSCNTWFFQMANKMYETDPNNIQKLFDIAKGLGLGQVPQIVGQTPDHLIIPGLGKGFIPPDFDFFKKKFGRNITDGDIANLAIGQGDIEETPLQVAWVSAQIAMPHNDQKLKLIRGVYKGQKLVDYDSIVKARGESTTVVPLEKMVKIWNVKLIQHAMYSVVNGENGTASRVNSDLSYSAAVAAKTGTGQWGNRAQGKYVAWLTGFFPHRAPLYAFAFFVEGKKGIVLSGGQSVAPLMNAFLSDPIVKAKVDAHLSRPGIQLIPLMVGVEEEEETRSHRRVRSDSETDTPYVKPDTAPDAPPAPRPRTLLQRFFGGGR